MERIRRIMWTARHHQRWEGHQGEIGDQGLSDCCRMANSIPENIAIRVRTDGTWRTGIATDTVVRDIGAPKLLRVGGDLLEMGRDIESRNLDRDSGFELL